MPSRKGWIFTGVLRIGKVGSEVTRAMGRHEGLSQGEPQKYQNQSLWELSVFKGSNRYAWIQRGLWAPEGEHLGNCWEKRQQVTREAGQVSWFPAQYLNLRGIWSNPRKHTPHISVDGKCWDLTACLGQTPVGFQIQSQVVEHTWHESEKSTSHMPLQKECSAGACCKNFLGQCRYL